MDRLANVKAILEIEDESQDALLNTYLEMAEAELISWRYALVGVPAEKPDTTPWDAVIVQAVINGYGTQGTEGQTIHNENGVSRTWQYADMVQYIHANVVQFSKVGNNAETA